MANTYTLKDVEKNIKDQAYLYCCLVDEDGKVIVPFNKASETKGAFKKFQEIKKRYDVLKDGIYYVQCKNSFNKKLVPDSYPIVKGNASLDEGTRREAPQVHIRDNGKVMGYQEALEITKQNAKLQAQVDSLTKELADLKKDYADLEADYNALEEKEPMEEGAGPTQKWVGDTLTQAIPIVDQILQRWDRSMDLREKGLKNGTNGKAAKQQRPQIPQPGTPQFEQYLDTLEAMDDAAFQRECQLLQQHAPEVYAVVYDEFNGEGEEEEQQEQPEN